MLLSTTLLTAAAAKDTSPDVWGSFLGWLFGASGLILVLAPVVVAAWLAQMQTRGPRAHVVAIRTAVETLALLEKGSPAYFAIENQIASEAAALGARVAAPDDAPEPAAAREAADDLFPGLEWREGLNTPAKRYVVGKRYRWLTGAGAAIGAVVLVLGILQRNAEGVPSGLFLLGIFVFCLGAFFTFIFNAMVQADKQIRREQELRDRQP